MVFPQAPLSRFRIEPVDDEDRQGLVDLLQRHGQEVQHYLAAIHARPVTVTTVVSPAEAADGWFSSTAMAGANSRIDITERRGWP